MPFKPVALSQDGAVEDAQLDADMAGIGFNLDAAPNACADIEVTLCRAARVGMEREDWRVLGVLVGWWQVHHRYVHAERLIQLVESSRTARLDALWSSLARLCDKDRRFRRLGALHEGEPLELLAVGNSFQVMRRGEDARFVCSALRVPAGVLRERAQDVLSPELLVAQHAGYKNRVLFGPSWRADLWTVLERDPSLTPAQAARAVGCAFSTAWTITRDFALLHSRADERMVEQAGGMER